MINASVQCRPPTRRLISALRRKTMGSEPRMSVVTRGKQSASPVMRNTRPNGDPPSVTLWGEE